MDAHLIQFSVVVVGRTHNPSILNPNFLRENDIVPKEWGWEVSETVTTPPFAIVRYANGCSVSVEPYKLQVTDLSVEADPTSSRAGEIAAAYVRTLPHVRYTAAGINFQSIAEHDTPEAYLRDRFIKDGPWREYTLPLAAAGIRMIYPLKDSDRVTLSLDAGEAQRGDADKKAKVIIANANFHRDYDDNLPANQVAAQLASISQDWETYCDLLSTALNTR